MDDGIIVIGVSDLTQGVLNIFAKNGLTVYGILEDEEKFHHQEIHGVSILGSPHDAKLNSLILDEDARIFVAYSNLEKKNIVFILWLVTNQGS